MIELWKQMLAVIFIAVAVCVVMDCFHYLLDDNAKDDKPEKLIIEVDGHEYVLLRFRHDSVIGHKVDCRFCKKEK